MRLYRPLSLSAIICSFARHVYAADKPYSTWMTDSFITRGVTPQRWYTEATFYRGVEAVANLTNNNTYQTFLRTSLDAVLTSSGLPRSWDNADHQLDHIRIGSTLIYLYTTTTPSDKYRAAITFLHKELTTRQKRTPSGGFWHKDPKYPNQMWLDGLFMAAPFYAAHTALFQPGNLTAWDDIALQFALVEKHCRNATSGLLKHGYDESKRAVWADPKTGASPLTWIRAQGWYLMALADVLEWFPREHSGWEVLRGNFVQLARALRREQDPASGGWWLVMDGGYGNGNNGKGPGKGNYIESSGTAMYTYGLLKGVRNGLFGSGSGGDEERRAMVEVAKRAYGLMTERFVARNGTGGTLNWEGTVRVGSLDGNGDYNVSSFCSFVSWF